MISGISGSTTTPLQGSGPGVARASTPPPPPPPPAADVSSPVVSQQATFVAQVAAQPTVRPEQVERAKQLLSSPNYPPRAIVESVAKLIADSQHE
jgi:hypothetical protein